LPSARTELTKSDIDLVVTKSFTESNKVRTLSDMARAMRQSKIADTVAIISKARVPIIKFVTNEGKLRAAHGKCQLTSRQAPRGHLAKSSKWDCSW
jgi:DNA polymerase sigma